MRALVYADRMGSELAPLTEKSSLPLLPVAGKEVLIYSIEELVAAGVRDLVVVSSSHGEQTAVSTLGDGRRWGAQIRYVLSRGEEAPSALWQRLHLADAEAVVALRGDILRSPVAAEFLLKAQDQTGSVTFCAGTEDPRGSLFLVRPGCPRSGELVDCLQWHDPHPLPADVPRCSVDAGSLNLLQDLPAFHRANLDIVAGRFSGLGVDGRSVALGLFAGRRAQVFPGSLKQGVAYIGANSRVHPEAELLGEVVIGDEVVVDRAATLRDCVILPRTYVGELVEVANAIVASNRLIRVDTGASLLISDAFLLGNLGGSGGRPLSSVWDRLVGGLLLLLSLPLWIVAPAAALLSGAGALMGSRELIGNRANNNPGNLIDGCFVARHWNTDVPVLRNLPSLLAVLSGDLRLVGVTPLTPEQSAERTEEWQRVRDRAPVGLFGPTQLNLPADAPLEECLLSDAFYAREQSWRKDMGFLLRALIMLFSQEGWRQRMSGTPRRGTA